MTTHHQVLTYLGNKRKLAPLIVGEVDALRALVGKEKLAVLDAFCGSAVVARSLAPLADVVHANDLEAYAFLQAKCFLEVPAETDRDVVRSLIEKANALADDGPHVAGIMTEHYAPAETANIRPGERCFFTHENAVRIDTIRHFIDAEVDDRLKPYLLGPLLIAASVHANTSGQFQAFHKNRQNVGQWGGEFRRCLSRITAPVRLECPDWPATRGHAYQMDVFACLETFVDGSLDVVYLDPPYNHRQYSSLYFLLNVIAENRAPAQVRGVAGSSAPKERNDSVFCHKNKVVDAFTRLLALSTRKSAFTLLSYSNEGLLKENDLMAILEPYTVVRRAYDHGRYNVRGDETAETAKRVTEFLYIIRSKGVKRG